MSVKLTNDETSQADPAQDGASVINIPTPPSRMLRLAPTDDGQQVNADKPAADDQNGERSQPASDETSPLSNEAPGKMSIMRALEYLAAQWFGQPIDLTRPDTSIEPLSPETAIAYASELGLELTARQTRLVQLHDTEFPCLAIDQEGQCRVLVRRINRWAFLCRTADRDVPVDRKHLDSTYSGSVFLVRPIEEFVAHAPHGSVDEDADHLDDRPVESVIGFLISTMLRKRPGALVQLSVAGALSNFLLVLVPIFSMAVYDRVIPHLAYETLWALTIGIVIALAADLAIRHVKIRLIDSIAADISHVVQVRFYRRLVHGRMAAMPRTGGALAQTIRDLESYSQLIPMAFLSLFVDVPFIFVTSIILAAVAGTVALVPLAGAIIVGAVFVVAHFASRARLAPFLVLMRLQSNSVIETIEGLETVKTTTAESKLLNKWERLADATAYGSHMSRLAHAFAQQWTMSISQAMTVATLVLGVYEISQNAMSVGALSAATMLVGRLIGPITQFVTQSQRVIQARKTLEPIRTVLNAPMERAGDSGFAGTRAILGKLDFINVGFTYPGSPSPSLNAITLSIRPGERIGIIGRVGSGKSTLLRLIVRLLETNEGAIQLDDRDIRQYAPRDIRRQIAYMRQDSSLFDDTLRANLFFGLDQPDQRLVDHALAISGVAQFASKNAEGFGFRVGPRGERLSGGERQAVGLARAMIGDPKMLLLDEPTAAMDNTIERQIINGIAPWLNGKTLIVATHRAALLDLVDRVILMQDGRIVADGPKDQVLRNLKAG
jgi:ATP-binding cassette subfamily C protein LapB